MKFLQFKRVSVDTVILIVILLTYITQAYEYLPNPLQLVSLKVLLVSAGFLHAHITRKLAFPQVNWEQENINAKTLLIISIYIIFIYAYSQGG